MSNKRKQIRVIGQKRGWIYVRYLFPLICALLIFAVLLIPCLQYSNNQSGTDEPISAVRLMKNSWDQVRNYLFGSGTQTNGNIQFSRTVLVLLILFWILFFAGIAVALWAFVAFLHYAEEDRGDQVGRIWFITLIPNRTVLCVLYALMLPLPCFPRIVILLYRSIYVAVELRIHWLDPMWVAFFLFAVTVVLSCITAKEERALRMDLFRKPKKPVRRDEEKLGEERKEKESAEPDAVDLTYEKKAEEARRAQAERIARLLRAEQVSDTENERKD